MAELARQLNCFRSGLVPQGHLEKLSGRLICQADIREMPS